MSFFRVICIDPDGKFAIREYSPSELNELISIGTADQRANNPFWTDSKFWDGETLMLDDESSIKLFQEIFPSH